MDQSQKSGWAASRSRELTPLGEGCVAEGFEARPAFEGAVMVEVVVDGRVGGGELLEASHLPEPRHRPLPSSKRQV
tara:strand:- start:38 stop:265 length:228 start_codon:yes stop_codon:yes gene_type:complete